MHMILAMSLDLDNEIVIGTFHFEAKVSPFMTSKVHFRQTIVIVICEPTRPKFQAENYSHF